MSQNIYNNALTPNTPVTISVPFWSGVVEFINNSPYQLDINGGQGDMSLATNSRVGLAGMANGSNYVVTPSGNSFSVPTQSLNLIVTWYAKGEMEPYPPTQVNPGVITASQQGAQANNGTLTVQNVAAGGSLNISTQTQNVYIYGFDITGDKSAAPNTGFMTITGLYDPKSGITIGTLGWWINQTSTGTQPLSIRFGNKLQGLQPNPVVFHFPSMSAGVAMTAYMDQY